MTHVLKAAVREALNEFRKPALKCERLGHDVKQERRRYFSEPENYRMHVADRCIDGREVCKRCRVVVSPWVVVQRTGIASLSMPVEHWEVLREFGTYPRREA
jgi:hypothetical protein